MGNAGSSCALLFVNSKDKLAKIHYSAAVRWDRGGGRDAAWNSSLNKSRDRYVGSLANLRGKRKRMFVHTLPRVSSQAQ